MGNYPYWTSLVVAGETKEVVEEFVRQLKLFSQGDGGTEEDSGAEEDSGTQEDM